MKKFEEPAYVSLARPYRHRHEPAPRFAVNVIRWGATRQLATLLLMGMLISCGGGGAGGNGESNSNVGNGGGDRTAPAVAISCPAPEAVVSGSIDITASATDNVGVAGVQFQLDGADFGAESATVPYTTNWNTVTGTNGAHTLTAVAHDAAGNRTTSQPVAVSVSNPAPLPGQGSRFEQTHASVSFSADWNATTSGSLAWSGGSAMQTAAPGARATFRFSGTSVTWIGYRDGNGGIARVSVDGVVVADVDLFARVLEVHTPAYTVNGLKPGCHTLTIEATGLKNPDSASNVVVVDAFDVPAPVVSHIQETDPDVVFTGVWTQADGGITWSGGGAASLPADPVGGARVSATANAKATLTFRGTAVSWSGARRAGTGIASVSVDGGTAVDVDTYAPTDKIQDVVFTKTGLTDAIHTLTITVTGRKNAAATGAQIVVDAFDVTTPGRRYQEEDAAVAYTGAWIHDNRNRTWSEGSVSESDVPVTPGTSLTFSFTGTSVSWIGCRKLSTGTADIFLDGVFVKTVDTFLAPAPPGTLAEGTEAYQTTIYRVDGLPNASHTLKIVPLGNGYIVIDAFDVRP